MTEDDIKNSLIQKFGFLENCTRVQRRRRIFLDTEMSQFREVFEFAVKDLKFYLLCTITGLDEGQGLGIIYHLTRGDGIVLSIKTTIPKDNPVLKTITDIFPNAEIYEREIADLLGARVEGLPEGGRYPLPDDWPPGEYPLRKDWKPKEKEL